MLQIRNILMNKKGSTEDGSFSQLQESISALSGKSGPWKLKRQLIKTHRFLVVALEFEMQGVELVWRSVKWRVSHS